MAGEANNVTLSTNFNVAPYYDDFDESKNFHRILFRPGLAVQARELTQIQSILQNQIDRFASNIFKEGSTVTGFTPYVDPFYNYVKLRDKASNGTTDVTVDSFVGKTIRGATSGVRAYVVKVNDGSEANTPNFKTLFVKYSGGNTSGAKFFANNEILSVVDNPALTCNTVTSAQGGATGFSFVVNFEAGVVYAKDHFIRVPAQTLVVGKYNNVPTAKVGFTVSEDIVTEVSDNTLLDPASGSYNYAAPGAARLKLTVNVASYPINATVSNTFVEIMQVKDGIVQSINDRPQYAAIRDYIARRTADESGDYIVNGYNINLAEHLKTSSNYGVYTAEQGGNTSYLAAVVQPGRAYVKGYDVSMLVPARLSVRKALDSAEVQSAKALVDYGNYVICDNVVGAWDVNSQSRITLRDTQANSVTQKSYSLTAFAGGQIGTARVRGVEHYTGTPGAPDAQYKVYLTDIKMNAGKSFTQVQSIAANTGTGSANGKADILYSNGLNANTYDASFDRAIFRLPANAVRRLRNENNVINNDFTFYKSFDVNFNGTGVGTINTGDSSETFDGAGTLSDDATRTDFYIVVKNSSNTVHLQGKVNVTSGGNTITAFGGSGTAFTTQVNKGDIISVANSGDYVVSSVNSDTSLNIYGTISGSTRTNVPYFKKFKPGQVIDFGGTGRLGNRSIAISSGTTATLSLNEGNNATSITAKAIVKLNKIDGQEASKSVVRNRLVQVHVGSNRGGSGYTANTTGPWPLGMSDGFKLISVRKKSGADFSTTTEGTDVTSHFTLDSGQTDNYYDHAQLVKKSSSTLSIANGDRLLVKFDHFTHSYSSGSGFLSVDSYPVNDATASSDTTKIYTYEIPLYTSKTDGKTYNLRDCVDIRPRITDTANSVSSLTNIATNPKSSITFDQPSGGLHFSPTGEDFTTDLSYYLRRKDVIALDKNNTLKVIEGVPDLRPRSPVVASDYMTLGIVNLPPYPSISQEVGRQVGRLDLASTLTKVKNERFTMRDIGNIRDRVDAIEYYTSLNLLEKNAKDLLIPDTNGNDRFKNGILVDSFTGHNIGNVHDADYKISIDPTLKEARPLFDIQNIELTYTANSSHVVRTNVTPAGVSKDQLITLTTTPSSTTFLAGSTVTSGGASATIRHKVGARLYVENATANFVAGGSITSGAATATISTVVTTTPGDLVTLPYTHKVLVQQPYATTTRNCIGTFYNYVGEMVLTPDTDYWMDTTTRPETNINIDLNTDNWMWLSNSWQTEWNNWQVSWTGQEVITSSSERTTGTFNRALPDGSAEIVETFVTQNILTAPTTETRAGVKPTVTAVNDKQTVGNYVKDVNIQPFMRSKRILFKVAGLKPNSKMYAFFDNVKVGDYVTPLTETEYNNGGQGPASASGLPTPPAAAVGSDLVTDSNGNLYGIFDLPNDASLRFHTGQRKFRVTDNPTNSLVFGTQTTSAETYYTSEGLLAGMSDLTLSTRKPMITNQSLVENRSGSVSRWTTSTGERVIGVIPADSGDAGPAPGDAGGGCGGGCGGSDPIAQSFLITGFLKTRGQTSGMQITKVDLFFATKDNTFPVTVQLQELDPITFAVTNRVVPFSRVILTPDQINVSNDASAPTPVYFPSPVYLEEDKEYAIAVIPAACNPNYSCWTAILGETDITTGNRVAEQPASGFLFTSANQRTWVPVESEDLKFTVYYAEFDKSTDGTLILKNENREFLTVSNATGIFNKNGEVIHGQTTLRVTGYNPLSGFTGNVAIGNSYVQGLTSGATGTVVSASASQIVIRNVSTDAKFRGGEKIRFRTGGSATTSPVTGNAAVFSATTPTGVLSYYDTVNFANTKMHISNVSYANSGALYSNSRFFVNGSYVKGQTNGYSAKIVRVNSLVADTLNLQLDSILPSNTSLSATAKYATSTTTRDSSFFNININDNTDFTNPRYVLSKSIEANNFVTEKSVEIKLNLRSFNLSGSPAVDLRRASNILIHNLISSNAEIGSSEDWNQTGGNSKSRYITRIVTLADGQDAEDLRIYLTGYKPVGSDIFVYAKVLNGEDSDAFNDSRWVPMVLNTGEGFIPVGKYSSGENRNDFIEFVYDMPAFSTTAILDSSGRAINQYGANTTNSNIFEYRNSAKARFVGFKQFAIKVVLVNTTSANPPRIRELRAIALQR